MTNEEPTNEPCVDGADNAPRAGTQRRLTWIKPYLSRCGRWLDRIDQAAGQLNVIIFVFAVGLATLDLTILVAQHVADRLPIVYRIQTDLPPPSVSPVGLPNSP